MFSDHSPALGCASQGVEYRQPLCGARRLHCVAAASAPQWASHAAAARPVHPLTSMIEELAQDLHLRVEENGLTAAPESSGKEADILVPVHQSYDMDILERIVQRCERMIGSLAAPER